MKKFLLVLTLFSLSLPVCAGDFFGDLFNREGNKCIYSIGDQRIRYAIDKNGNKYVYSIGDQRIRYAIDKNGNKYIYSIGDQRIRYAVDKNVTNK